ncbi:30S ribosomal protein S6 [Candidatus Roizmanbacteria bacterium]|nr:30S ribosomal protein S6 [Candidatus Roizmanbacteria bacterium]
MKYELTFLLNEEAELKNIKDLITSLSGKIEKEENWGEKTLVYPIKKLQRAKFYNLTLDIDKTKTAELRKKLNFNEKLIRFLLLVKE